MAQLETYRGVKLWYYVPNLPLAIAFAVLFAIVTAAHAWKLWRTRIWFCVPFVIGGVREFSLAAYQTPVVHVRKLTPPHLVEVIGFAVRAICHNTTGSLVNFLLQGIFLVLPPVFFAASLYMVYTRILRATGREDCSIITSRWSTRLFLIADFACLNIQGNGAGLFGSRTPKVQLAGQYIVSAGTAIHVLVFVAFVYLCVVFHRRFNAYLASSGNTTDIPWRASLKMLYWTSAAITVRNVFRTVEYAMGNGEYLYSTEWPLYVLDSSPMLLVMIAFFIWYPSDLNAPGRNEALELSSRGDSAGEPFARPKTDEQS